MIRERPEMDSVQEEKYKEIVQKMSHRCPPSITRFEIIWQAYIFAMTLHPDSMYRSMIFDLIKVTICPAIEQLKVKKRQSWLVKAECIKTIVAA